jgi:hypothetical protein
LIEVMYGNFHIRRLGGLAGFVATPRRFDTHPTGLRGMETQSKMRSLNADGIDVTAKAVCPVRLPQGGEMQDRR